MEITRNPTRRDRSGALRNAQSHFDAAEARTTLVKQIMDAERTATDAKTAKLRALRLAKEEADRIAAANAPAPVPMKKKTKKQAPA